MKVKLKYVICIIIGIILYYIVNTLCQCNVERLIISGGKGGGMEDISECKTSIWEEKYTDYSMYFSEREFKGIEKNLCKRLQLDRFDLVNNDIDVYIEMIKVELNLLYYGQDDNSDKLKLSMEYIEENFNIDDLLRKFNTLQYDEMNDSIDKHFEKFNEFIDKLGSQHNLSTLSILHNKFSKYNVSKEFYDGLIFGRPRDTINITITILDEKDESLKYLMLETNRFVRIVGEGSIINIEGKTTNEPFNETIKGDVRVWITREQLMQEQGQGDEVIELIYQEHEGNIDTYALEPIDFEELSIHGRVRGRHGIDINWLSDVLSEEEVINLFRRRLEERGLTTEQADKINAVIEGRVELHNVYDKWYKKIPIRIHIETKEEMFDIRSSDLPHLDNKEILEQLLLPDMLLRKARRDIDPDILDRLEVPLERMKYDEIVTLLMNQETREQKHLQREPRMIRSLRNLPPNRRRIVDIDNYQYYGEIILRSLGQDDITLLNIDRTLKEHDDIDFPDLILVTLYQSIWETYKYVVNKIRELQEGLLLLEITKRIIDETYTIPKVTYNVMGMKPFELNYIIKSEELIDIIKEKINIHQWMPFSKRNTETIEEVYQIYLEKDPSNLAETTETYKQENLDNGTINFKNMKHSQGYEENITKVRRTLHNGTVKWEFLKKNNDNDINIMYSYPIPRLTMFSNTLPTESIYFPLKLGYENRDRIVYAGNILSNTNMFSQLSPKIVFTLKNRIEEVQREERDRKSERERRINNILDIVNSEPIFDIERKAIAEMQELITSYNQEIIKEAKDSRLDKGLTREQIEQLHDMKGIKELKDKDFTKEEIEQLYDRAESGEGIAIVIINLITQKEKSKGLGSTIRIEKLISLGHSLEEAREITKMSIEEYVKK